MAAGKARHHSFRNRFMSLDTSSFHAVADATIDRLAQAVDRDLGDEIDVDIQGGVLSLDLPGQGQYILNKSEPLHQVWLSSPKSGAWHFTWNEGRAAWLSTRHDDVELLSLVVAELAAITGTRIDL